jgi:thiamine kinase-like enzyme
LSTSETDRPAEFEAVAQAAERVLSGALDQPVTFTRVVALSEPDRSCLILRCTRAASQPSPASFVIKVFTAKSQSPQDPTPADNRRLLRDWVGSQFLSRLRADARHGPRFYGGDLELSFVILEDLGQQRSLVDALLNGEAASAEQALLRYAARLGQVQADAADKISEFESLLRALRPAVPPNALLVANPAKTIQIVQGHLAALDVAPATGLEAELTAVAQAIVDPGPFRAYVHGDPCPDNVFDSDDRLRLIDFEYGHFGHALLDGTYARMHFPTCWCANRLPHEVVARLEARYRAELSQGCVAARDDEAFEQALVTICGYWLLNTLARHLEDALAKDDEWGIATIRQRLLARLEAFETTAEEFCRFPALRGTVERLHTVLAKRWPETPPLPLYPAFREPSARP